tara:strand:- start:3959 stop:4105 length:147 start_codon:yes stop_codon:yes gene_type:complete
MLISCLGLSQLPHATVRMPLTYTIPKEKERADLRRPFKVKGEKRERKE